jgi:hypothetical protein
MRSRRSPAAQPTLADDAWVKDRRNNGAFYLSLNGLSRTGKVRSLEHLASTDGDMSITVGPNPSQGAPVLVEAAASPGIGLPGEMDSHVPLLRGAMLRWKEKSAFSDRAAARSPTVRIGAKSKPAHTSGARPS